MFKGIGAKSVLAVVVGLAACPVRGGGATPVEWVAGEVIVGFRHTPEFSDLLGIRRAVSYAGQWRGLGPCLSETQSVDTRHPLRCVRVVRIAPDDDVALAASRISRLPGVVYAHPNYITRPALSPNDPYFANWQYGQAIMRAPEAWELTTGDTRIIVAVADSGLRFDHEDLQDGAVWRNNDPINGVDDDGNGYIDDFHGWDFVNGDNDPAASSGHGTHVAGIIAARINNATGIAGMSNCTIMPLQVFDGPYGTWEAIASAIVYAADNGANVLNFSGGGAGGAGLLAEAVQYASQRGMVIVTAAGNHGTETPYYPAAYPETIAVAGTGRDDVYYASSGRGLHIDVAAPGVGILSSYWRGESDYYYASGTSMAAAQVSGLVALMFSLNPDLSAPEVRTLLHANAVGLGDPGFDIRFGWGRVDAAATLESVPYDDTSPRIVHGDDAGTRPFSGYIDPRAERIGGEAGDLGIDRVTIRFSEPVRDVGSGPSGLLTADAFAVVGGGDGAPTISSIDASGNPVIAVFLTGPIAAEGWTTLVADVEDTSGNRIENLGDLGAGVDEPDRVDLGFLPGDLDQSGEVGPFDLLALRRISVGQEQPARGVGIDYADIDRNGVIEPVDLLTFRQLVQGVGSATQVWAGRRIPVRP